LIQQGLRWGNKPEAVYEKVLGTRITQLRRHLDDLATQRIGDFQTVDPEGRWDKKLRDFPGKILDSDGQLVKREMHGLFFPLHSGECLQPELNVGWGITREGRLLAFFIRSVLVKQSSVSTCRRVTNVEVVYQDDISKIISLLKKRVRKPLNLRQPDGRYIEGEWLIAGSMVAQISQVARQWEERRAKLYDAAAGLLHIVERQDEQLNMLDPEFRHAGH
jgi:hypothetical protein